MSHYPVYTGDDDEPIACSACSQWKPAVVLVPIDDCARANQRFEELDDWIHNEGPRPNWLDALERHIVTEGDPPWWIRGGVRSAP